MQASLTAAMLVVCVIVAARPVRAQAEPEEEEPRPKHRRAFVHTTLGGALVLNDRASWGVSAAVLVGGAPASWLVIGAGVGGAIFPRDPSARYMGVLAPFAQVWLDTNCSVYVRASVGLATANTGAGPASGAGFGVALGFEPRGDGPWSMGPTLQATYAANTFVHDCDHSCPGGWRYYSQLLFALGLAVTHR